MGNRQSFSARQRERLASSFESTITAKKRKEREMMEETTGKRRKKDHVGRLENTLWDKDGLKKEVDGYPDETKVNWSELARRFEIRNKKGEIAKNGGQIAQEFLIKAGSNIHRFNCKRELSTTDRTRIRRKKLRGIGG